MIALNLLPNCEYDSYEIFVQDGNSCSDYALYIFDGATHFLKYNDNYYGEAIEGYPRAKPKTPRIIYRPVSHNGTGPLPDKLFIRILNKNGAVNRAVSPLILKVCA